ncbi:MAG: PASTA domain-containing protein [Spirochaetia bacterium]
MRFSKPVFKKKRNFSGDGESKYFRYSIYAILGALALMILSGIIVFLIVMEGPEETKVPDTLGMNLEEAMITLQEYHLQPWIQLRTSSDPSSKGKVLNQKPSPGTVVKVGKRIQLSVSQGALIDEVEDFIGQELNEVKLHFQTIFSSQDPLMEVGTVSYVFDEADPGTIVGQFPDPGTRITGFTPVDFWISRGPNIDVVEMPDLLEVSYDEVITRLADRGIPFRFVLEDEEGNGTVISQNPAPGTEIDLNTVATLTINRPEPEEEDTVFGMFEYVLPDYPVALEIQFQVLPPEGDKKVIFGMKHPGGKIGIPYEEQVNSTLSLIIAEQEAIKEYVLPPAE